MSLRYKVVSSKFKDKNIFVEVFKIIEALSFDDYLKEISDNVKSSESIDENGIRRFVFHPSRNYDEIKKRYNAYRIETGELWLINKKHNAQIDDYVNYDPSIDELALWDLKKAKQNPNLQLIE